MNLPPTIAVTSLQERKLSSDPAISASPTVAAGTATSATGACAIFSNAATANCLALDAPARRSYLVLVSSPDGARAIQNALAPQGPPSAARNEVASQATEDRSSRLRQTAPLLTFARSRKGAEFCLSDDPHGTAGYDAVLWEMPHDASEALSSAAGLVCSAASVPVIGVRFSVPSSRSQKQQLRTDALAAGLLELVGAGALSRTALEDILGEKNRSVDADALKSLSEAVRMHAHDVRNPLNCIQMLTDLMRSQLQCAEFISEASLDKISSSVARAEAVLSELSAIAKSVQPPHAAPGK